MKEGPVDEFMIESGKKPKKSSDEIEQESVKEFVKIGNPNTEVLLEKMNDFIQIYNHTSEVYVDKENVYLISDNLIEDAG